MKKNFYIYLEHILESINSIVDYIKGMNQKEFLENKMVQDAVIRHLEIIGEATKKSDKNFKEEYNFIPWRKMAGMRDKLIHDYMGIDIWAVWDTVDDYIPELKEHIEKIIQVNK